jgi:uncharacterized membrane protein YkvA (DUF1232 family)
MIRILLLSLAAVAVLYALVIVALILCGRQTAAREAAVVVPNLVLLFKDLVRDRRVPRRCKLWLLVAIVWIASPIDLIPEFVPFLGPLDDAVVAALALRHLARSAGPEIVLEHWRGDPATISRLVGRRGRRPSG